MHFLRYQEFYESPKYKNKQFTILDFIQYYTESYGNGVFSYVNDFWGYNVPDYVFTNIYNKTILDHNKYDETMKKIYEKCSEKYDKFYIIGAYQNDKQTVRHEISHALYYLDKTYKNKSLEILSEVKENYIKTLHECLKHYSYNKSVFNDELVAYMSTGIDALLRVIPKNKIKPLIKSIAPIENKLAANFEQYLSQVKL
jgi:hypothetical protein